MTVFFENLKKCNSDMELETISKLNNLCCSSDRFLSISHVTDTQSKENYIISFNEKGDNYIKTFLDINYGYPVEHYPYYRRNITKIAFVHYSLGNNVALKTPNDIFNFYSKTYKIFEEYVFEDIKIENIYTLDNENYLFTLYKDVIKISRRNNGEIEFHLTLFLEGKFPYSFNGNYNITFDLIKKYIKGEE